jgi:hypothetical protein
VVRRDHDHVRLNLRLPLSLPVCAIALHRGNLTLDAARGEIDAQVHRGNIRLTGRTGRHAPDRSAISASSGWSPTTATTGAGNSGSGGGPDHLRPARQRHHQRRRRCARCQTGAATFTSGPTASGWRWRPALSNVIIDGVGSPGGITPAPASLARRRSSRRHRFTSNVRQPSGCRGRSPDQTHDHPRPFARPPLVTVGQRGRAASDFGWSAGHEGTSRPDQPATARGDPLGLDGADRALRGPSSHRPLAG